MIAFAFELTVVAVIWITAGTVTLIYGVAKDADDTAKWGGELLLMGFICLIILAFIALVTL